MWWLVFLIVIVFLVIVFIACCYFFKIQVSIKDGEVVLTYPGDPGYNILRETWAKQFDFHPKVIIQPTESFILNPNNGKKLIETIKGKNFAIRGAGHCFEPYSSTNGILIDLSLLQGFEIRTHFSETVAKFGAGWRLGPVYQALNQRGYMVGCGTRKTVGISQALNGGIGYSTKFLGLLTQNVVEMEILLANGEIVITNDQQNQDLFWALKGCGSGNFGIVLSYTFKIFPTRRVSVFTFHYPLSEIFVIEWLTSPERIGIGSLTCQLVITDQEIIFTGQNFGTVEETEQLIRELPKPKSGEIKDVSFIEAVEIWNTPTQRDFNKGKSRFFLKPLSKESIKTLIDGVIEVSKAGTGRFTVGLQQLKPGKDSSVSIPWMTCPYWANFTIRSQKPLERKQLYAQEDFYQKMLPVASPWSYSGFFDLEVGKTHEDYRRAYFGKYYDRLVKIKKKYDPGNLFHYEQSILPC